MHKPKIRWLPFGALQIKEVAGPSAVTRQFARNNPGRASQVAARYRTRFPALSSIPWTASHSFKLLRCVLIVSLEWLVTHRQTLAGCATMRNHIKDVRRPKRVSLSFGMQMANTMRQASSGVA